MSNALEAFNPLVDSASGQARLPPLTVRGFDGDFWVTKWREELSGDRFVEVLYGARPDSLNDDGLQLEISATAWMTDSPGTSWTRPYLAEYVSSSGLVDIVERTAHVLSAAWKESHDAAQHLEEVKTRRERALDILRERGIRVT